MFGWRKKRDGFEWRGYVRTTILVRRQQRRQRIMEAKEAALEGLAEAGRLGAEAGAAGVDRAKAGLEEAGRGAAAAGAKLAGSAEVAGRRAAEAAGSGLKRAGAGLARGLKASAFHLWQATKAGGAAAAAGGGAIGAGLKRGIEPGAEALGNLQLSLPLGIAGVAALIGAVAQYAQSGLGEGTIIAGGLAAVLILLAALPALAAGVRRAQAGAGSGHVASGGVAGSIGPAIGAGLARFGGPALTLAAVLGVAAAGLAWSGWLPLSVSAPEPGAAVPTVSEGTPLVRPAATASGSEVRGHAVSLSGDTFRIGDRTIRLAGLESPELNQTCARPGAAKWRCGQTALNALRRITGYSTVTCTPEGTDAVGRVLASCQADGKDIGAELVRQGYVFASAGLFPRYAAEEAEAKAARAGIWRGSALRPDAFRATLWDEAVKAAPGGCPIKGRSTSRGKTYLLPWSNGYDRFKVREGRGDRWFCTESEAKAAGWKPAES